MPFSLFVFNEHEEDQCVPWRDDGASLAAREERGR